MIDPEETKMDLGLSPDDRRLLQRLEEDLWRPETRFDPAFMEAVLAADFFEFGRSGRTYTRAQSLAVPAGPIDAVLPLPNFQARLLAENVALVTYDSHVTYDGVLERGRRSSIWGRTAGGWQLRFHQGTPF
jgi:hypothetical protein